MKITFLILIAGFLHAQNFSEAISNAKEMFKNGKHEELIALLTLEIESYKNSNDIDPTLIKAVMMQGKSSIYQWKWEDAERYYQDALDMSFEIENDSLYLTIALETLTVLTFLNKDKDRKKIASKLLLRNDLSISQRSDIYSVMASVKENQLQLDSAIYFASKATEIDSIHKDSSSLPFTYYDLGNYYISNLELEKGISKIHYGLNFLRGDIDGHKKASMEIGLGNIYYNIGNISKARSLANGAIEYAVKNELHVSQTMAYNLLGNCEKYQKNYKLALDYYMKSDSVNSIKINNKIRSNRAKISIVNTKLNLGEIISIDEINLLKEIHKTTEIIQFKNQIEALLLRIEKHTLLEFEEKFNTQYARIPLTSNNQLKRSLLGIKKEFYQKNGLFLEALIVDKQLDSLNKYMLQKTNNFTIQELDAKYSKQQQDIEIAFLDDQNKTQSKLVSQQRKLLGIGTLALALISFLSFFLFRLFRRTNKQKDIISKTLAEKDILLREIHHRVKNNLQLVSSLLTMQGRSIDDVKALEAINQGKSRVRSMALIHQDLYNKENLTGISVKEYIEKLTTELFMTYRVEQDRITLKMNIEDIELDVDTMVPLGLIINELITNSLKYAFPEETKGELVVFLNEIEGKLKLEVSDNGIGYDLENVDKESFGTTLVYALTEQLEGELTTSTSNGTITEIHFSDFKKLQ